MAVTGRHVYFIFTRRYPLFLSLSLTLWMCVCACVCVRACVNACVFVFIILIDNSLVAQSNHGAPCCEQIDFIQPDRATFTYQHPSVRCRPTSR